MAGSVTLRRASSDSNNVTRTGSTLFLRPTSFSAVVLFKGLVHLLSVVSVRLPCFPSAVLGENQTSVDCWNVENICKKIDGSMWKIRNICLWWKKLREHGFCTTPSSLSWGQQTALCLPWVSLLCKLELVPPQLASLLCVAGQEKFPPPLGVQNIPSGFSWLPQPRCFSCLMTVQPSVLCSGVSAQRQTNSACFRQACGTFAQFPRQMQMSPTFFFFFFLSCGFFSGNPVGLVWGGIGNTTCVRISILPQHSPVL